MRFHQISEGTWNLPNKSGTYKRFKSDSSPEAIAWMQSTTEPKEKPIKIDAKKEALRHERMDRAGETLRDRVSSDQLEKMNNEMGMGGNIDDFQITQTGFMTVDGISCAAADIRITYVYSKEDDLGIEDDEPVSDGVYVRVRRDLDVDNKLVLVKYL